MRTILSSGLVLLLLACASSSPNTVDRRSTTDVRTVTVDWWGGHVNLGATREISITSDTVDFDPQRLWTSLPAVYDSLGIRINVVNSEARLIGAVQTRLRGKLGTERPSRYLRCGTNITGSVADQYDIYLTAVTQVSTIPNRSDASVLSTHVRALAQRGGIGNPGVECASRGRLEREIRNRLLLKLTRGGPSES